MKKIKLTTALIFSVVVALSLFTSCQPNDIDTGNGIVSKDLDASFTVTPVTGAVNKYLMKATSTSHITSKWDAGNGEPAFVGKMEEEIYFPDAGTYIVKHYAIGIGGQSYVSQQNVVVATSDPAANLVQGGLFANAEDHAKWTVLKISSGPSFWTFNNGSASVTTAGGWSQQGIYQAIEVEANQEYKIDMTVSSPDALVNTWFYVYASTTVPEQGVDYKTGLALSLNTWNGCGLAPFDGKLSVLECGVKKEGIVKFPSSGTIYLVINCGAENSPTITIKNVQFRKK